MKRCLITFALIAIFVSLSLLPIPVRGEQGAYNTWSRLFYCSERWACLHEIGHSLDQQAGWISQSKEFSDALQIYILAGTWSHENLPIYILAMTYTAPDGQEPTKTELYAYLFQAAEGKPENMPDGLRPFYDWGKAEKFIERLHDGQHIYWMR